MASLKTKKKSQNTPQSVENDPDSPFGTKKKGDSLHNG
jgi:hypothetical protein